MIYIYFLFTYTDGKSNTIKPEFEKFATSNKGIFRIGSIDCDEFKPLCDKESITTLPTIRLYPTFPMPTTDIPIGETFDPTKLKKAASRLYSDKSIEISNNNHKTFVEEDVGTPKVLLFTNAKKGTPFIYKALSQNF